MGDLSYNHCEPDGREKCPKGCRTCSQVINADFSTGDIGCDTCNSGWVPKVKAGDLTVCERDGSNQSQSANLGCRVFKTKDLTDDQRTYAKMPSQADFAELWACEECRPGYAKKMGTDVCESIHTTKGCVKGNITDTNRNGACECRPGFELDPSNANHTESRSNVVLEWLPEVFMPNSMKAWNTCIPKRVQGPIVIYSATSANNAPWPVPHCIHTRQEDILKLGVGIGTFSGASTGGAWWYPKKKRCRACEQGYFLEEKISSDSTFTQKCQPMGAAELNFNLTSFCTFMKVNVDDSGVRTKECAMCANNMTWDKKKGLAGECTRMGKPRYNIAQCEYSYLHDQMTNNGDYTLDAGFTENIVVKNQPLPRGTPSARCFQCKFGYVARRGGRHCLKKGKHGRGCRREVGNSKCLGCRLGFYQNFLNSNRHGCLPDPMYHCGEFKTTDKNTCKCKDGALQMSYDNDFCKLMSRHCTDRYWGQIAKKNRINYNDMCYKKKAIELMTCSKVRMSPSPGQPKQVYTGLGAALQAYLADPAYTSELGNIQDKGRLRKTKKMLKDMSKHKAGYEKIGIHVNCEDGHMLVQDKSAAEAVITSGSNAAGDVVFSAAGG